VITALKFLRTSSLSITIENGTIWKYWKISSISRKKSRKGRKPFHKLFTAVTGLYAGGARRRTQVFDATGGRLATTPAARLFTRLIIVKTSVRALDYLSKRAGGARKIEAVITTLSA
jgi:hypothetical protein